MTKIAKKVDPHSKETQKIIKTMFNAMQPNMVGLAAPQIGIPKRIILVDVAADGKGLPATPRKPRLPQAGTGGQVGLRGGRGLVGDLRVYINPKITWLSKTKGEWYEGCYSTGLPAKPRKLGLRGGRGRICGIVSRSVSIKIKAFTLQGEALEAKYIGYAARIFQHEIDHLNGKVFVDHIVNPDHLHWVEKKEFPIYRDKEAWRNWPKKASLPLANQP